MTLKLNAPGGGSVTIDVPTTASNFTLTAPASTGNVVVSPQPVTVPNATGTVMVSGNMPAFSANASGNQSISNNTWTKVSLQTEAFDTANCFDNVTNFRFTPNVAGYYQINFVVRFDGVAITSVVCNLYKNGVTYQNGTGFSASVTQPNVSGSVLLFLNGSTDYVELYGLGAASSSLRFDNVVSHMSGVLVRTA